MAEGAYSVSQTISSRWRRPTSYLVPIRCTRTWCVLDERVNLERDHSWESDGWHSN